MENTTKSPSVLPASPEDKVQQAFAAAGPDLRLEHARLAGSGTNAVTCDGAGGYPRQALTAVQRREGGTATGQFCARWPDGVQSLADRIQEAWSSRPTDGSWQVTHWESFALLLIVAAIELFAFSGADPEFFMPDPFRWLVLGLVALYLVTGLVPSGVLRFNLRVGIGLLPSVLLLGFEVHARVGAADQTEPMCEKTHDDPILRYRWRPGAPTGEIDRNGQKLSITADGLFDEPYSVQKPAGVYRVVVLGDSVPNDLHVPFSQRFPKRLEVRLNEMAGSRRVEVINVSCHGYNTLQEVRLLEQVGLRYQPDMVVMAYVLNDPFMQDGAGMRIGNSFFLFRLLPAWLTLTQGSTCGLYRQLHEVASFELVVRQSFERLAINARLAGFEVMVALVPLIEPFDDSDCAASYDKVEATAKSLDLPVVRIVDEMPERDHTRYLKPQEPSDVGHPNAAGHSAIAEAIARRLAAKLRLPPLDAE